MARLPRGCAILSLIWRRTCNGAAGPFTRSESGFASARPWFHPRLNSAHVARRPLLSGSTAPATRAFAAADGVGPLYWPSSSTPYSLIPRIMTASIHSPPLVLSAEFTLLGWVGAVAEGQGLCWVTIRAHPPPLRALQRRTFQPTPLIKDAQAIESLMTPIRSYLHMQSRTLEVPFDTRASAFCETVWGALRRIPYGQTRSYTEIAAAIGAPRAVRAVANACAKNPLALITPCHRVIQKNGRLGGYRWGVARKAALLALENRGNTHARAQNLFTILLRTRDTGSGGARNPHIYQICSASCAPSFPV